MGLFTYVTVPKDLLPKEYQNYSGWQTKDVILDPFMQTLEITENGELFYLENEYEWVDDESMPIIKGYMKSVKLNRIKQDFHGDMAFCGDDGSSKNFVDLVARFSYGKLDYIKSFKYGDQWNKILDKE